MNVARLKFKHKPILSLNPMLLQKVNARKENKYNMMIQKIYKLRKLKYDFNFNEYYTTKFNLLTDPKTVLYRKYIEFLLIIDSAEFLTKFYSLKSSKEIMSKITLDYSINYFLIPNYLTLEEIYPILSNCFNLKQKKYDDKNSNENDLKHQSTDSKLKEAIEVLGQDSFSLYTESKDHLFLSSTLNSKESKPSTNNKIEEQSDCDNNPIRANCSNSLTNHTLKDSIDSVIRFAKYIDIMDINRTNRPNTQRKPRFDMNYIMPVKKYNTKTITKAKSSVIHYQSEKEKNHHHQVYNDNLSKAKGIKSPSSKYSSLLLQRNPKDKFVSTEVFFEKMKEKEKKKLVLNYKDTREIEKLMLSVTSMLNTNKTKLSLLKNNNKSNKLIKKQVMLQMNKQSSLPYFGSKQKDITKNKKPLVLDTLNGSKQRGVKQLKCFSESNRNHSKAISPITTPTKKRIKCFFNNKKNQFKSNMSNSNKSIKLKSTVDSLVVTHSSMRKTNLLNEKLK